MTMPDAAPHVPVLRDEAVSAVAPAPGKVTIDATFGAGGYTQALLDAGATVIAFDRDPSAIAAGQERFAEEISSGGLRLVEAPFDQLADVAAEVHPDGVDGVVFDFGVSSMQLDQAARGFSFMQDGPLDMRMGAGRSAADFIATTDEAVMADVFFQYGEERQSRRLARAIVADRKDAPFTTTGSLAALAERVLGRGGKIHPATRMFQAIRIFVNDELGQVVRALIASERALKAGGQLAAVSFHSLEDRIVKRFLQEATGRGQSASRYEPEPETAPATFDITAKAVAPSVAEVAANRRARSARLRSATRTDVPMLPWDAARLSRLGVPPITFSDSQRAWRNTP